MSDFTYIPDYALAENLTQKTLITPFENGTEQRRSKWNTSKRRWVLNFGNISQSEMEGIRDFWISKNGPLSSFTWTNHNDNTEYTVRFEEDSLKIVQKAYQIFDVEVRFIEVK